MKKINWIKGCTYHFFSTWLRYNKVFLKKEEKTRQNFGQNTFFGWLLAKPHSKKSVKGAKNGFTSYFSKNKNWMPFNSLSFFSRFYPFGNRRVQSYSSSHHRYRFILGRILRFLLWHMSIFPPIAHTICRVANQACKEKGKIRHHRGNFRSLF